MKNVTSLAVTKIFFVICAMLGLSQFVSAQDAEFVTTPASVSVSPNDTFQVVIQVQVNAGAIDGAEVHLNFDPVYLKVNGITRLSAAELPTEIVGPPSFNNTNGTVDYVAGALGSANLSTSFDFISIDFEAILEVNSTTIGYNYAFPRPTKITGNFVNVLSAANDVPVEIATSNENPVASFTATPTSGTAALFVSVDAGATLDPDGGTIDSYDWDFGDLSTSTGITSDHIYTEPGTFTITLTVTDNDGGTDMATQNIVVSGITIPTYTITASAGPNGSIDPETATVDEGGSQTFTITPDEGYEVADVLVDAISQGPIGTLALTNVLADTEISATFTLLNVDTVPEITLDATASVVEGGNLSVPFSVTDADGDNLTVTITSISNEPQELQSNNTPPQSDPYPFDASGFLTENITNELGGIYSANLVFAPKFGDGGSNGDGSGTYSVTVSVTDADNNTVTETLELTVNDAPQLIGDTLLTHIEAESYDNQGPANAGSGDNGIGVEDNTPGGVVNIGFTNNGDFAEYLIDVATAGTYTFSFQVAKAGGAVGTMTINGGPASIAVSPTGGWQTYSTVNTTVTLPTGQQTLRFDWSGPNGFYFNMDSFLVEFLSGVNNPPIIEAIADVDSNEGSVVTVDIPVVDDGNSPLSVTIEIFDKSVGNGTNTVPLTSGLTVAPIDYSFTDDGNGTYSLIWATDNTDGRSYSANVTADDGINPPVTETFTIDLAQNIVEGPIKATTFNDPVPYYGGNPASGYTVSIESSNNNIGYIDQGEAVEYLIYVPSAGSYELRVNASKGTNGGGNPTTLTISEDNGGFTAIATISIPNTGWNPFVSYTAPVTFSNAGVQKLRFDFGGTMNIQEFEFTSLTGNTPPIVEILTPAEDATFEVGSEISFTATANDTQDDDVTASLIWNSNIDDDFGTGATINTSALSVGTHTITATATDNDPSTPLTGSASITVSIYQTAPECDVRYRVNAGGALFASSTGDFEEDQSAVSVGGTAQTGTPSSYINLATPAVDKTYGSNAPLTNNTGYPDFLFQTERYSDAGNPDNMKWFFPTENGIYDVKILFNENWTGEINDPRVFDVEIEGVIALDNYRPSGISGTDVNVAKVATYQATVTDGTLNINFIKGTQNPSVKGFDICFVAPVSDTDPEIAISEPLDGATIDRNVESSFSASVTDAEDDDTDLTATLTWSSATDPSFAGTGGTFTDVLLVPGTHVIEATVTDSDDNTVTESITVTVPGPIVTFNTPTEEAILTSTDVEFTWSAQNMLLFNPFDEHFHFYVNPADPNNLNHDDRISTASEIGVLIWQLGSDDGIVEGENTVVIVAAESLHTEFTNPEARDIVTFTVCSTLITDVVVTEPTECDSDNGEIEIVATGVNLEYSIDGGTEFAGTNNFSGLPAGTYAIVVREAGTTTCTATDTVTLIAPEAPFITSVDSTDPTDCSLSDGTLDITATGTDLEYSIDGGTEFAGTNSFSGLLAGTYAIVVREAGTTTCTATDTVTLTAPEAPSITSVDGTDPTSCNGVDGELIIVATGTNLEYSIDDGNSFASVGTFVNLTADTYPIVVREVGTISCSAATTATLQDPIGTTPIITGPLTYMEGSGGVTLDAGAGFASYLWSPGGETTQTINALAGTYSVTVTETNGCEGTSVGVIVTEDEDTTPPEAICQNLTVQLDANGLASIVADDINNGSNDISGIADISINTGAFDCSNIGANTVTLTVMDNNDNISTCSATVTVEDTIAPVIACPANINMLSSSLQVLEIIPATAADNCVSDVEITFERSDDANLDLNAPFPQGITTIQWTATDASGNADICVQTITITLPQSTANEILSFTVSGQVGPEVIDSNGGMINLTVAFGTEVTSLSPSIDVSELATINPDSGTSQNFLTSVNYIVTAEDGSTKPWTVSVSVEEDDIDPEITCPGDIVMDNDIGVCGTSVSYQEPVGTDNLPGATTEQTEGLTNGEIFPIGITTQTYVVTDAAGNTSSCSFTVTVNDSENPVISCPTVDVVMVASGITSALVTFDDPSISDNCPDAVLTQIAGLSSGSQFPVGTTVNTFQVSDGAENIATCSFDIIVEEEAVSNVGMVSSFTLIDADSDVDLFDLSNGMVIDVNTLSSLHLDVRANTTPVVESVSFVLSGAQDRTGTENVPPYALFQYLPIGDYMGGDFTVGNYTLTATPFSGDSASGNQGSPLTINFELVDGDPDCVNVEITVQTVTDPTGCDSANGSIVLNVSGTTGILDFDWGHDGALESATATGLAAGSYSVTVTDANGCSKTVSAELVGPTAPTVSLSAFADISATASPVTLTGGLPLGGSYSGNGVSNGVFNPSVGPGTYIITYAYEDSATGCSNTATRPITVTGGVITSDLLVLDANTDTPLYALTNGLIIQKGVIGNTPLGIVFDPSGNVGSVNLKLTGPISQNKTEGAAPYSLFGDIGVDIQGRIFPIGQYTLVVTPKIGPKITVNFEVSDVDPLCANMSVTVQSKTDPTTCNGSNGSLALAVSGTTGNLDFAWSHNTALEAATATGLAAGSYSVTVTDANGCSKTVSAELVGPTAPTVSLSAFADISATASPVTLTGGFPLGGSYSGNGVSNGLFNPSVGPGTYIITYTFVDSATGCSNTATRPITVTGEVINSDLLVLDANTDTPLYALTEGLIIQKSVIGNTPLGIVFEPAENVGSVIFKLTGPISQNKTEGAAPFSLFGDIGVDIQGRIFPIGQYTLVVTPKIGPKITVNFEVSDIDPLCGNMSVTVQSKISPNTCNGSNGSIALAISGTTGNLDFAWSHDGALESATATGLAAGSYSVTVTDANGCSKTVSVSLSNPQLPTVTLTAFSNVQDTTPAFALGGGLPTGGTYSGSGVSNGMFDPAIGAGTYTITYSYTNSATGCMNSAVRTIKVTSTSVLSVSGFTLVNAVTDTDILTLTNGMVIDVSSYPTLRLDIRANTTADIESVRLVLTGAKANQRTENVAPYALYGDSPAGNYLGSDFMVGSYSITATPYTSNGLKGTKGSPVTVNFTLVQGVSNTAKFVNSMQMSPNPATERTTVSFGEPVQLTQFLIYDILGRVIKTIDADTAGDIESIELTVHDLPIGTYFVRTTDTSGTGFQQRLVIEQ